MKKTHAIALALIASAMTAACQREESTTVVAPPAGALPAESSSASSTTATTTTSTPSSVTAGAPVAAADQSQAMDRLQRGAQQLRESIQAMAQEPVGPRRNDAIRRAHEALMNTKSEMLQLPPEIRGDASASTVGATGGAGGGAVAGPVYPNSDVEYTRAMEKLMKSAQSLREGIQALAQQQPGPARDQAIKQAQQALYDVNSAMIQLPPDMRVEKK